eukprot:Seg2893.3 transcript_id=Seg2893.3/GoldUCD/mRNA.D3Y31 product="Thiamin pyrophosphokinase 1" protein_id=Seg2893.3/GoldUCD/D3Y31
MALISRLGSSVWQHLTPLKFLEDVGTKSCILVLNQPLFNCLNVLKHIWKSAVIKVCADGGINRLNEACKEDSEMYIPDVISGDFDSAHDGLLKMYEEKGTMVVNTPDQDETDFTKSLRVMLKEVNKRQLEYDCIVCFGAFDGRLDHVMSNINTLYTASTFQAIPCYLLSSIQVVCLLQPGSHVINVDTGHEGDWCGLIPIGAAARNVYTTGLKWNLDGQTLAFGSLISSSNAFESSKQVTVETTDPLLWTMGIKVSST